MTVSNDTVDEDSAKILKKYGGQTPVDEDAVKLLQESGGQTPVKTSGGKAQVGDKKPWTASDVWQDDKKQFLSCMEAWVHRA